MVLISILIGDLAKILHVSVPLRGLWFLSVNHIYFILPFLGLFPSPCGDYGSYEYMDATEHHGSFTFPSPCGDYGSYLICTLTSEYRI